MLVLPQQDLQGRIDDMVRRAVDKGGVLLDSESHGLFEVILAFHT
jgi:hypothetical protein